MAHPFCFVFRQINQHLVTLQQNESPPQPTRISGEVSLVAGRKAPEQAAAGEAAGCWDGAGAKPVAPPRGGARGSRARGAAPALPSHLAVCQGDPRFYFGCILQRGTI